jgi:hypothetical protein
MKCPYCSAEIGDNAVICKSCHAQQVVRRTTMGVVVGWLAIILAVQVALAWIPLPFMVLFGFNIKTIPWQLGVILVVATLVNAGMFWYSKSTRHLEWIPPRDV